MTDLLKQIKLHIAGATVRHKSKFATLASFENNEELSQDFIDTWVVPYYMNIGLIDDNWTEQLLGVRDQITKEIVTKLLAHPGSSSIGPVTGRWWLFLRDRADV